MSLFKTLNIKNTKPKSDAFNQQSEKIKCLILGSGPAGFTAAIYAARANLHPVIYEGIQPGGQLTTTTEVDNYPGYPKGVTGSLMMEDFKEQAMRFGTDVRVGLATETDLSKSPFKIIIDGEKLIETEALIIATGATAKYLGLPSEDHFKGQGVSACATCDGFFYRGQDVAVVGGGDTAAEEATYLAGLCKKVYLIVRKNQLRASKAMQDRVLKTQNIEMLFEHTTKEITGDTTGVIGVILLNSKNEEVKLNITGFFVAIGHVPNSDVFKPYIKTDEVGYILTNPGTSKTNIEGIFACGDVQDSHYRQAITAAGSGCMAAMDTERYLSSKI